MSALDKSLPAEIVGRVMCDYTIKTAHPFLESAIVGIDDLNMADPGNNTNASGQVNRTMSDGFARTTTIALQPRGPPAQGTRMFNSDIAIYKPRWLFHTVFKFVKILLTLYQVPPPWNSTPGWRSGNSSTSSSRRESAIVSTPASFR